MSLLKYAVAAGIGYFAGQPSGRRQLERLRGKATELLRSPQVEDLKQRGKDIAGERASTVLNQVRGKSAESLQPYLTKGKQIYVEGRLQTRQWDDKDGNKRYTTEIRGDRIVLLGGGGMGTGSRGGAAGAPGAPTSDEHMIEPGSELTDDDIPF